MEKRNEFTYYLLIVISIASVYFIICIFSDIWPWNGNVYNSYTLQALSWLNGRLDLTMDYSHLEIAYYQDSFYVIFPPFPSIIMLPFTIFFKENTPDHFICLAFAMLAGIYAYRIAREFRLKRDSAFFWSIFLVTGNNFMLLTTRGWVWFIAQTTAFAFTLMAFYYATRRNEKRSYLALFFLCCAFGCRPFQIIYTPLILFFLYKRYSGEKKPAALLTKLCVCAMPAIMLGVGYMLLNYFRFGNVFNFGREYLPEFADSQHGEFSLHYLHENMKNLLALPYVSEGRLRFQKFNGTAFYIVMPMYISYAIYSITGIIKGTKTDRCIVVSLTACLTLHILSLCMHITMGGWQFGNRYIVDALPAAYFGIIYLAEHFSFLRKYNYPLFLAGLCINTAGTIYFYLDLL